MNFLSPDSLCYSFDHRSNGYSRGEGFGVVVIKTLASALENGDTIRAVIRSTGSNQDGHTPGITQPSSEAQESLIKETYRKAGLSMRTTMFFESHGKPNYSHEHDLSLTLLVGTGTPVGDPIEANSIGRAFKSDRRPDEPLYM
jgi:acyl transferase domain-containing protein